MKLEIISEKNKLNENFVDWYCITSGAEAKKEKRYFVELITSTENIEESTRNFSISVSSELHAREMQDKFHFAISNIEKIKPLLNHMKFNDIYSRVQKYGRTFEELENIVAVPGTDAQVQKQEQEQEPEQTKKKKYDSQKRAEKNYKAKFEEFKLRLTKEQKETLKRKAEKHKMSINSYLIWLMDNDVW